MRNLKESLLDDENVVIDNTDKTIEDHFKFYNHFKLSWYDLFKKRDETFTDLFKKATVKKYSNTLPKLPKDFYGNALLSHVGGLGMTKARNIYMLHLLHIVGCCEWTGDENKFLKELEKILNELSIKKVYVRCDNKRLNINTTIQLSITIWDGNPYGGGIVLRFNKL